MTERPTPRRLIMVALTTLTVCGLAFGAYQLSLHERSTFGDCGPYDEVPALAAPSVLLATTCVLPPDLSYEGVEYRIGCEPVPAKLVGELLVGDGGETRYEGARRIVGIPPGNGLLLQPNDCKKGRLVALSTHLTDAEYDLISPRRERHKTEK